MTKLMSLSTRKELVRSLAARYTTANRTEKIRLLDEFIATTGYHRKYAMTLLKRPWPLLPAAAIPPEARHRTYTAEIKEVLITVWKAAHQICSKRLVPFLPEFITALERNGHVTLSGTVRRQLLQISPATVDRLLKDIRGSAKESGQGTTRPGSLLKHQIPIRTFSDWDDLKPGFMEADLVAHCGTSTEGAYLNSLVLTDVATSWTEFSALLGHDQEHVLRAMEPMRALLPFPLLGLDTDNGSEFLNYEMFQYCRNEQITFTRGRPYKKNDQCHVEQKNGSIVRRVIGYDRFEGTAACRQLAMLYGVLRLYVNFFQPSMKLVSKERQGSKIIKRYDRAQTPYQRVLASPDVTEEAKALLRAQYERLDPVELLRQLEYQQDLLWPYAYHPMGLATSPQAPSPPEGMTARAEVVIAPPATDPNNASGNEPRRYRRIGKPRKPHTIPHTWRTRKDPFEGVWAKVQAHLEENPRLEVKALFGGLQRDYPGQFRDGQLRTLQRRVRAWRSARTPGCEGTIPPEIIVPLDRMEPN